MKMNKFGLVILALVLTQVTPTVAGQPATKTVILNQGNLVTLTGEVDGETVSTVITKAKEMDAKLGKGKPIYLFLNTPGGSVQSGLELIEALQGLGRPVHTVILFAASMGWQIAQNMNDRLILKNGVLMSHHATGEFAGAFGGAHPSQVDNRYQLWLDRVRELDEHTVSRTKGKQTYESYINQYNNELWLTGSKAVIQGYADDTVLVKCADDLSGFTTHSLMVPIFNVTVNYDLDNCPINTSPIHVKVQAPESKVALTYEQTQEVKRRFLEGFFNKQKQVIPMTW